MSNKNNRYRPFEQVNGAIVNDLLDANAELKRRLFKAETERGMMIEEYDKLKAQIAGAQGVLGDVVRERARQHGKWDGVFDDTKYNPLDWHEMISDYNGWARRMRCMGSMDKARTRYIQIAALAVAAVEALDAAPIHKDCGLMDPAA